MFYNQYVSLLKKIALLLGLYLFSRVEFVIFNIEIYKEIPVLELVGLMLKGLRYDLSLICLINLPLFVLFILPSPFAVSGKYELIMKILFMTINIPFLLLNFYDIAFYPELGERLTLTNFYERGSFAEQLNLFFTHHFYLVSFMIIAIGALVLLYPTNTNRKNKVIKPIPVMILFMLISLILIFASIRGSFTTNAISVTSVKEEYPNDKANVIINSPYNMFYSFYGDDFIVFGQNEEKHFEQYTLNQIR